MADRAGDEQALAARAAFHERYSTTAEAILRALPRPARPDRYPDRVRTRLDDLVAAAGSAGAKWRWAPADLVGETSTVESLSARRSRLEGIGFALLYLAIIALLLIGLATAAGWVLGAVL